MARTVKWTGVVTLTLTEGEGEALEREVLDEFEEAVEGMVVYVIDAGYSVTLQRDARRER